MAQETTTQTTQTEMEAQPPIEVRRMDQALTRHERLDAPASERWIKNANALAAQLDKTRLLPKDVTGQHAIMMFLYGREHGFAPLASLNAFYVVNNRVSMGGEAMLALLYRSGAQVQFGERSAESATVTVVGPSGATVPVTWTIEDAKRANLTGKDNWKLYPRAMLTWRAVAEAARLAAPDVMLGIYLPDEVEVNDLAQVEPPVPQVKVYASEDDLADLAERAEAKGADCLRLMEEYVTTHGLTPDAVPIQHYQKLRAFVNEYAPPPEDEAPAPTETEEQGDLFSGD